MGFFGFLKKQEPLAAPQKPTTTTISPLSSATGDDIPPPPQPDELTFENLPGEARLIHDDVHHDSDLDALLIQEAPKPGEATIRTEPTGTPEPDFPPTPSTEIPDLPALQTNMPAPKQQEPTPQPTPTPSPTPGMQTDTNSHDLPDFSDEEIAAAEQEVTKPEQPVAKRLPTREKALPPLKPLPILSPSVPEELYVEAHQYQTALKTITTFKTAVQKGDAALSGLGTAMNSHKQQFAAFAEQVNAIQEDLIRIDNIMMNQR